MFDDSMRVIVWIFFDSGQGMRTQGEAWMRHATLKVEVFLLEMEHPGEVQEVYGRGEVVSPADVLDVF